MTLMLAGMYGYHGVRARQTSSATVAGRTHEMSLKNEKIGRGKG